MELVRASHVRLDDVEKVRPPTQPQHGLGHLLDAVQLQAARLADTVVVPLHQLFGSRGGPFSNIGNEPMLESGQLQADLASLKGPFCTKGFVQIIVLQAPVLSEIPHDIAGQHFFQKRIVEAVLCPPEPGRQEVDEKVPQVGCGSFVPRRFRLQKRVNVAAGNLANVREMQRAMHQQVV